MAYWIEYVQYKVDNIRRDVKHFLETQPHAHKTRVGKIISQDGRHTIYDKNSLKIFQCIRILGICFLMHLNENILKKVDFRNTVQA